MDSKTFQVLYLCNVIPHYFLKYFNKYMSKTFRSSSTFGRYYSAEVIVHVEIQLYLLPVKVMIYARL
jgi:hypothetical protein